MTATVMIAGAGIGGLTAALALQRAGFKVRVYDQADQIGDVGAGISLGISACAGLFSLGLENAIVAAADELEQSAILHYATGEALGPFGNGGTKKFGSALYQIHRADLYAVLLAAVEANDLEALSLGRKVVGFKQDAGGVTATFSDSHEASGEVLIGADGLRSSVRSFMFGEETPRFTGQVVYRFLIPIERVRPQMQAANSILSIGPGKTVLRYLVRHGQMVNGVAFVHTGAWTDEGWSQRATPDEMLALFEGWHEDVRALMRNAPLEGTAKWALYDRAPLPRWIDSKVALLGDAAHPMLPFLGLGAAMGIEDGVMLGRAMGESTDLAVALKLYEAARRDRANSALMGSRLEGQLFQGINPESFASAANRPSGQAGLYDYNPATAPLPDAGSLVSA